MSTAPWWTRFANARLRLDLLLQGCATAFLARAEQQDTVHEADRLSAALETAAQIARDVLKRGAR